MRVKHAPTQQRSHMWGFLDAFAACGWGCGEQEQGGFDHLSTTSPCAVELAAVPDSGDLDDLGDLDDFGAEAPAARALVVSFCHV